MIRRAFHPLFQADIDNLEAHILDVTGDPDAARRRVREIDDLVRETMRNPLSGHRLDGALDGYMRRSGGRDHKISVIFEPHPDEGYVLFLVVAFGGQNWSAIAEDRL